MQCRTHLSLHGGIGNPVSPKKAGRSRVEQAEAGALFGRDWDVELLARRAILEQQPRFQEEGLTTLETVVYRLERR